MSYKKLIPNIYLKDEKAYADKDLSVLLGNGDAVAAANRFSENGADEILVMDLSYDDDSHEKAIGILRQITGQIFSQNGEFVAPFLHVSHSPAVGKLNLRSV